MIKEGWDWTGRRAIKKPLRGRGRGRGRGREYPGSPRRSRGDRPGLDSPDCFGGSGSLNPSREQAQSVFAFARQSSGG